MSTATNEIISRASAKADGRKTYFTGKPCPKGHVADRAVSSGTCIECRRLHTSEWREKNKSHMAAYAKEYRAARGSDLLEAKREYQRRWNAANKQEKRKRDAEYEKAKRESGCKKFYAARSAISAKRRAAEIMAVPTWCDHDAVEGMYELAQVFRRIGLDLHVDHIVPLQSSLVCGLHSHDNLRLSLRVENQQKGNRYWPDMWPNGQHKECT